MCIRDSLLILDDRDEAGIASQAASRFRGNGRTVFDPAVMPSSRLQRFRGNVHDNSVTLAAAHRLGTVREKALEDHGHRVGALLRPTRSVDRANGTVVV